MISTSWALPNPTDADVVRLNELNALSGVPAHLRYLDYDYPPAFCHISAKDIALRKGGRRVHGWSYWRMIDTDAATGQSHALMIAEHHSVWETVGGELVDVTPPRYGGDRTLFLRDDAATIVSASGEIPIRANLADLKEGVFLRGRQTVESESYVLPDADAARARHYAKSIGFNMSNYPTDREYG